LKEGSTLEVLRSEKSLKKKTLIPACGTRFHI